MNCPNCGRELAEGEVCRCIEENTATAETQAPVEEAAASVAQEAPAEAPQAAPQPEQPQYASPQYAPPQGYNAGQYYQAPQGTYFVPNNDGANYSAYAPQPQPKAPARTDYPEGYSIKRKYVAVLLGAFLGAFGIHDFYLGSSNKGVAHILITAIGSLLFGIGFAASYIWAIVETVQILTEQTDRDENGFKIQTFEEALVKTRMEAEQRINK